jgi:hypothetical protein
MLSCASHNSNSSLPGVDGCAGRVPRHSLIAEVVFAVGALALADGAMNRFAVGESDNGSLIQIGHELFPRQDFDVAGQPARRFLQADHDLAVNARVGAKRQ